MGHEGTLFAAMRLPYPWPPAQPRLLISKEVNEQQCELIALTDGRLAFNIPIPKKSFISQPIDVQGNYPQLAIIDIAWSASTVELTISGQPLEADAPGVPRLLLRLQTSVPDELSMNAPNAVTACQKWIDNRKAKFASPTVVRTNRRAKTIEEQANDLRNSIVRLKHLGQQTLAGNRELLGTLAGEMRASIFWVQDAQRDRNYSPLLLRMASLAELPLPVYFVPDTMPSIIDSADMRYVKANAPRVKRLALTDQVCDLQESLVSTVLRLGQAPGKTITPLEAIKELAHTMGAAHYDEDASEFLDVLEAMKTSDGDQLMILMCHIAESIASLSEWVLSELKTRSLIA